MMPPIGFEEPIGGIIAELTPTQLRWFSDHNSDDLVMWTVYDDPTNFPGKFVARPFSVRFREPYYQYLAAGSYDELIAKLPPGLTRLLRNEGDDPKIVETWI